MNVCLSSKNTGVKETRQRQQSARYAAERTGSDPPQPCERHVMWHAILSQPWGGGKKRVLWLTSLAKLASFRLSERSCLKNSSEEQVKETSNLYLWPLRALNTHAHKQTITWKIYIKALHLSRAKQQMLWALQSSTVLCYNCLVLHSESSQTTARTEERELDRIARKF